MVASGNMNGPNLGTYYYSIISIFSVRTVVFLAELNNIETRTGDISNTYLTARTNDNILFNTGPEFAPFGHASHLLIIKTALYFFKRYGARFYYRLSDSLTALGFFPSMVGCDICMCNEGD